MGYLWPRFAMPRRNSNAQRGGNPHRRNSGAGFMKGRNGKKRAAGDKAPMTGGAMHSKTRLR